ncbi:head-tail connector protein [Rhodovulum kholense]|uniref:Putative phage protein (Predicted DNA packaging) n=1 Tax=Rhodovulum kholense TaxID=453584 RepID=A0A8E2VH36_9RHOB|nr:head-tail connector protein [Rhodovulum kholense]PTW39255.1 putative phage protein (predicted DNA packaging) [Rhodovulum kholense]
MTRIPLEELKRHCQAEGFEDDDLLLAGLGAVAERFVADYTRRDLDAAFPGGWPGPCQLAAKLLVAHWYRNREAVAEGAGAEVPLGVRDLLAAYRDLG